MATKTCPNCGWRKDLATELCHCGYEFPRDAIPSESLEHPTDVDPDARERVVDTAIGEHAQITNGELDVQGRGGEKMPLRTCPNCGEPLSNDFCNQCLQVVPKAEASLRDRREGNSKPIKVFFEMILILLMPVLLFPFYWLFTYYVHLGACTSGDCRAWAPLTGFCNGTLFGGIAFVLALVVKWLEERLDWSPRWRVLLLTQIGFVIVVWWIIVITF